MVTSPHLEARMADLPEGWTDDLTVALAPGRTVEDLVEHVIQAALRSVDASVLEREVRVAFGLSEDDAALALDRVFGGITRAATRNPANCPDRNKDPIAWTSFTRASREPSIIAVIIGQPRVG
jgi:hypothetical protein